MNAVLRMCCPDRAGIVAELSNFIYRNRGNIVHLDQHVDPEANVFFARIEWMLEDFLIAADGIEGAARDLVRPFEPTFFALDFTDRRPRVAIFVTKESHCLYDLLVRHDSGELVSRRLRRVGHQHPPLVPAGVRGREALSAGVRARREGSSGRPATT